MNSEDVARLNDAFNEAASGFCCCGEDFCAKTFGTLTSQVLLWRSEAAYLRGKVEGLEEAIEVLKRVAYGEGQHE